MFLLWKDEIAYEMQTCQLEEEYWWHVLQESFSQLLNYIFIESIYFGPT